MGCDPTLFSLDGILLPAYAASWHSQSSAPFVTPLRRDNGISHLLPFDALVHVNDGISFTRCPNEQAARKASSSLRHRAPSCAAAIEIATTASGTPTARHHPETHPAAWRTGRECNCRGYVVCFRQFRTSCHMGSAPLWARSSLDREEDNASVSCRATHPARRGLSRQTPGRRFLRKMDFGGRCLSLRGRSRRTFRSRTRCGATGRWLGERHAPLPN